MANFWPVVIVTTLRSFGMPTTAHLYTLFRVIQIGFLRWLGRLITSASLLAVPMILYKYGTPPNLEKPLSSVQVIQAQSWRSLGHLMVSSSPRPASTQPCASGTHPLVELCSCTKG